MRVEVLYFASLRDRTGVASESVEVARGWRVSDLWQAVVGLHPALGDVTVPPLVVCDLEYASWERPLDGVCEVAFLPPVSGG